MSTSAPLLGAKRIMTYRYTPLSGVCS